jgi:hypothetical protein
MLVYWLFLMALALAQAPQSTPKPILLRLKAKGELSRDYYSSGAAMREEKLLHLHWIWEDGKGRDRVGAVI